MFDGCKVRSGAFVACLLLATLALFPATTTESKYVWEETIGLRLQIKYDETEVTDGPSHTSESVQQEANPDTTATVPSTATSSSDLSAVSTACEDSSSVEESTDDGASSEELSVQEEFDETTGQYSGPGDSGLTDESQE